MASAFKLMSSSVTPAKRSGRRPQRSTMSTATQVATSLAAPTITDAYGAQSPKPASVKMIVW